MAYSVSNGVQRLSVDLPERGIRMSYIDIAPRDYGFHYQTTAIPHESGRIRRINTHWQWYHSSCPNKGGFPSKERRDYPATRLG